jgi:pimeloyl-ACP methyl ester carboxylesterase
MQCGADLTDPLLSGFEDFIARSVARPGTSRHIDATGVRLHYLEWRGPAEAPPLLLLHGYLAHAHWWDFVAPWLAQHHRVVALDFGGMGDSGRRAEYSHAQFHAEITSIVEATGIAGCTAIGHSFGGRALLYACRDRPDLFARAVVVDSRLGSPEDPVRGFDQQWRPNKRYADEASILQRFTLRPLEPAPAAAMDHMARRSVRAEDGYWSWKFDENITRLFQQRGDDPTGIDDVAELAGMRTPVDFIYGEESRVVTPERAARLATCLPDVRSVTGIPASHHHLPVSQPIALVATLRALLGSFRG